MIDGSFCIMSLKDKSCVGLIISNLHYFGFVLNSSQTQGQTRPCFLNFQGLCIVQSLIFKVLCLSALIIYNG